MDRRSGRSLEVQPRNHRSDLRGPKAAGGSALLHSISLCRSEKVSLPVTSNRGSPRSARRLIPYTRPSGSGRRVSPFEPAKKRTEKPHQPALAHVRSLRRAGPRFAALRKAWGWDRTPTRPQTPIVFFFWSIWCSCPPRLTDRSGPATPQPRSAMACRRVFSRDPPHHARATTEATHRHIASAPCCTPAGLAHSPVIVTGHEHWWSVLSRSEGCRYGVAVTVGPRGIAAPRDFHSGFHRRSELRRIGKNPITHR